MLRNVALDLACLRWPVPGLACLLPPHDGILTETDKTFSSWCNRLRQWCRERKGVHKGFSWSLRLFLLCAHDLSLAECGYGEQGYKVSDLLVWVKRARPLERMGLALYTIAEKVCTGLQIPTDHSLAAFGEIYEGIESKGDEKMTSKSMELPSVNGVEQLRHLLVKQVISHVDESVYVQLRGVIQGFERETSGVSQLPHRHATCRQGRTWGGVGLGQEQKRPSISR